MGWQDDEILEPPTFSGGSSRSWQDDEILEPAPGIFAGAIGAFGAQAQRIGGAIATGAQAFADYEQRPRSISEAWLEKRAAQRAEEEANKVERPWLSLGAVGAFTGAPGLGKNLTGTGGPELTKGEATLARGGIQLAEGLVGLGSMGSDKDPATQKVFADASAGWQALMNSRTLRRSDSTAASAADGTWWRNPTWWVETVGEAIPTLAAQVGLAAATGGTSLVGQMAVGGGLGGALGAGGHQNEAIRRKMAAGADLETASAEAGAESLLVGTVTSALEAIPFAGKFLRGNPLAAKAFQSTLAKNLTNVGTKVFTGSRAKQALGGALAEGITEAVEGTFTRLLSGYADSDPKLWLKAFDPETQFQEFAAGAVLGGPMGAIDAPRVEIDPGTIPALRPGQVNQPGARGFDPRALKLAGMSDATLDEFMAQGKKALATFEKDAATAKKRADLGRYQEFADNAERTKALLSRFQVEQQRRAHVEKYPQPAPTGMDNPPTEAPPTPQATPSDEFVDLDPDELDGMLATARRLRENVAALPSEQRPEGGLERADQLIAQLEAEVARRQAPAPAPAAPATEQPSGELTLDEAGEQTQAEPVSDVPRPGVAEAVVAAPGLAQRFAQAPTRGNLEKLLGVHGRALIGFDRPAMNALAAQIRARGSDPVKWGFGPVAAPLPIEPAAANTGYKPDEPMAGQPVADDLSPQASTPPLASTPTPSRPARRPIFKRPAKAEPEPVTSPNHVPTPTTVQLWLGFHEKTDPIAAELAKQLDKRVPEWRKGLNSLSPTEAATLASKVAQMRQDKAAPQAAPEASAPPEAPQQAPTERPAGQVRLDGLDGPARKLFQTPVEATSDYSPAAETPPLPLPKEEVPPLFHGSPEKIEKFEVGKTVTGKRSVMGPAIYFDEQRSAAENWVSGRHGGGQVYEAKPNRDIRVWNADAAIPADEQARIFAVNGIKAEPSDGRLGKGEEVYNLLYSKLRPAGGDANAAHFAANEALRKAGYDAVRGGILGETEWAFINPEVLTSKGRGESKVSTPADLANVAVSIGPQGTAISLRDLRKKTGLPKEAFDALVLKTADGERAFLHEHDAPSHLSPEERQWLVKDENGAEHIGIVFEPAANPATAPETPPASGEETPPSEPKRIFTATASDQPGAMPENPQDREEFLRDVIAIMHGQESPGFWPNQVEVEAEAARRGKSRQAIRAAETEWRSAKEEAENARSAPAQPKAPHRAETPPSVAELPADPNAKPVAKRVFRAGTDEAHMVALQDGKPGEAAFDDAAAALYKKYMGTLEKPGPLVGFARGKKKGLGLSKSDAYDNAAWAISQALGPAAHTFKVPEGRKKSEGAFKTWLYTIARNKVRSDARAAEAGIARAGGEGGRVGLTGETRDLEGGKKPEPLTKKPYKAPKAKGVDVSEISFPPSNPEVANSALAQELPEGKLNDLLNERAKAESINPHDLKQAVDGLYEMNSKVWEDVERQRIALRKDIQLSRRDFDRLDEAGLDYASDPVKIAQKVPKEALQTPPEELAKRVSRLSDQTEKVRMYPGLGLDKDNVAESIIRELRKPTAPKPTKEAMIDEAVDYLRRHGGLGQKGGDSAYLKAGDQDSEAEVLAALMSGDLKALKAAHRGKKRGGDEQYLTPGAGASVPRVGQGRRPSTQPVGTKEKPISVAQVVRSLESDWEIPVRTGKLPSDALGVYKKHAEVVRLQPNQLHPVEVTSHEIAHHLDNTTDVMDGLPLAAIIELQQLDYDPTLMRESEGFAEYMRIRLTQDPATAAKAAPHFTQHLDAWLGRHSRETKLLEKNRKLIDRYYDQGAKARVDAQLVQDGSPKAAVGVPLRTRIRTKFDQVFAAAYTRFKDALHPLARFEAEARKRGFSRKAGEGPTAIARAQGKSAARYALSAIQDGVFTMGEDGFKTIGDPLTKSLAMVPPAERQDFTSWIYARHALEALDAKKSPGITKADAQAVYDAGKHNAHWVQAGDGVTKFNNDLIRVGVAGGVIPLEDGLKILAAYRNYVPLFRAQETSQATGGPSFLEGGNPVKSRTGSFLEVIDPIAGTMEKALLIYQAVAKQQVLDAAFRMVKETKGLGSLWEEVPPDLKATLFSLAEVKKQLKDLGVDHDSLDDADQAATLMIFRPVFMPNSKKQIVRVNGPDGPHLIVLNSELQLALESMDPTVIPMVLKPLQMANQAFKLGATGLNVGFGAVTNPLKDFQTYLLQRKEATTAYDATQPMQMYTRYAISAIKELAGGNGDSLVKLFQKHGGELGTDLEYNRKSLGKGVKRLFGADTLGRRLGDKALSPLETLKDAIGASDAGPRLAEFQAALRNRGWTRDRIAAQGVEDIPAWVLREAINAAHDVTLDFRRMGTWGKYINAILPYWNARWEGRDKFLRTFRENGVKAMLPRVLAFMGAGLFMAWLRSEDDDDKEKPAWLRKYATFADKEGNPVARIPHADNWGSFVQLGQSLGEYLQREDPQGFKDLREQLFPSGAAAWGGTLAEETVNIPAIKAGVEATFNYSTFRGKPIVPHSLEKLKPEDQTTGYDDAVMMALGKELGVSPAKLTHIASGVSGGAYSRVSDAAGNLIAGKPGAAAASMTTGGVTFRKEYSRSLDAFYEASNGMSQEYESAKLHGTITPEMEMKMKRFESYGKELTRLRKEVPDRAERERLLIGTAREALGLEPLKRYPVAKDDAGQSLASGEEMAYYVGALSAPEPKTVRKRGETTESLNARQAEAESKFMANREKAQAWLRERKIDPEAVAEKGRRMFDSGHRNIKSGKAIGDYNRRLRKQLFATPN